MNRVKPLGSPGGVPEDAPLRFFVLGSPVAPGQGERDFSDTPTMEESFPGLFGAGSGEEISELTEEVVSRFSHKLNNVTATILGKAELARLAVKQGKVQDSEGKLLAALEAIEGAVAKIGEALEILNALPGLKKEQ